MNNNEPIILGKVKKGKTGKPLVVIIIFLFIGSILFFAPTIMSYFGDYNVIELIKSGEIIPFIINHEYYIQNDNKTNQTTTSPINKNEPVLVNMKTVIEYNNFALTNFKLEESKISFNIKTSNIINFDKSNYYLILLKNNKEIKKIKLMGEIKQEGEQTIDFSEKIENTVDITATVKEIKSVDYPSVSLSSDESGLASIICTNKDNVIEYLFSHNQLINITDTFTYVDKNDGNYSKVYEEYNYISSELNSLGAISNISEDYVKFVMTTRIDLSTYQYNNNKNYNYYSLNTPAKIIDFEMKAKGFDCK